jgi:hypothetical protein
MRTTSRMLRTVLVAAGLMAVSATAAQAMAMGPANAPEHDPLGAYMAAHHQLPVVPHSPSGRVVLHKYGHQLSFAAARPMAVAVDSPTNRTAPPVIAQPMAAAVDSPTNQTAPPVIAQPVAAQSADTSFDWTAAALGAFVASLLLIVAALAATVVRPRQTVQL